MCVWACGLARAAVGFYVYHTTLLLGPALPIPVMSLNLPPANEGGQTPRPQSTEPPHTHSGITQSLGWAQITWALRPIQGRTRFW